MAQQTAVDEIILAINEQMDLLEMDANNHVEWSMLVMHKCLKALLFKCNQAKIMYDTELMDKFGEGYNEGLWDADNK